MSFFIYSIKRFSLVFIVSTIPVYALSAGLVNDVSYNEKGKITVNDSNSVNSDVFSSVYAAKDTYGMRANAVVAAFSANSERPFDYPVLGFNGLAQMATYKDRDSVGLYADNTSLPFKSWEIIKNVSYDKTSFIAKNYNTSKLKAGMLVETDSSPSWSSYIFSVSNDIIETSGWVNNLTGELGTPNNGSGLVINPITKIWATNFNVFFPENGRAKKGVVQENGLINNNVDNPSAISGIDTVVLPQSKFGGMAAYLARSADSGGKQQWNYGFLSKGSKVGFLSSDSGTHSPDVSFHESSSANDGLIFDGKNKSSSVLWKQNDKITAKIDPNGLISLVGYKTTMIRNNAKLSLDYARYIINNDATIYLTLPERAKIIDGFTMKILKVGNDSADIIINSPDSANINGKNELTLSGKWSKEIVYYSGEWFIY